MTLEGMKKRLRQELTPSRYKHSIEVMNESVKLAKHYGVDVEKAEIAGLLHDCAKQIKSEDAMQIVKKHDIILDEIQKNSPSLHHGILGPVIAYEIYGVTDKEILDAIYWHSTGKAGMTPLEKIVFVADYIEPGRKFDNIIKARKIAYEDLNRSILMLADLTIAQVILKKGLLHPETINARNYALSQLTDR